MKKNKDNKLYKFLIKVFSKIGKRQRLIIGVFLMTLSILVSTFYDFQALVIFIPVIFITVYIFTFLAILEGISRHEMIALFIHPIYFSLAFYLFYFFLPQRWLTRAPFIIIYAVSMYAILLSQNIFNIGVNKSLQLFRAAFSVNYLFLTITSFISYSLIISLRLSFIWNFFIVLLATFPLAVQMLWSIEPKEKISRGILVHSVFISLLIGEIAAVLSFMPVNQSIFALVMTAIFYSLAGLFQVYFQQVLFKERVREFVIVLLFTFAIFYLSLGW